MPAIAKCFVLQLQTEILTVQCFIEASFIDIQLNVVTVKQRDKHLHQHSPSLCIQTHFLAKIGRWATFAPQQHCNLHKLMLVKQFSLEKNLNFLTRYSCRIDDCPLAFLTFIKFPEVQDRAYFPSQFPAYVLEF